MSERKDRKLRWRYLPLEALKGPIKIGDFGNQKYSPDDWKESGTFEEFFDAAMRHMMDIQASSYNPSQMIDEETGLPHCYAVCYNALIMCWLYDNAGERGKFKIDRDTAKKAAVKIMDKMNDIITGVSDEEIKPA